MLDVRFLERRILSDFRLNGMSTTVCRNGHLVVATGFSGHFLYASGHHLSNNFAHYAVSAVTSEIFWIHRVQCFQGYPGRPEPPTTRWQKFIGSAKAKGHYLGACLNGQFECAGIKSLQLPVAAAVTLREK